MGLDGIITIAILAVAGTWAGRRLWRAARNRVTGDPDGAACGGGGCGHCPLGTELGGGQPGSPCVDPEALAAGGSGVTAQPGGERAHGILARIGTDILARIRTIPETCRTMVPLDARDRRLLWRARRLTSVQRGSDASTPGPFHFSRPASPVAEWRDVRNPPALAPSCQAIMTSQPCMQNTGRVSPRVPRGYFLDRTLYSNRLCRLTR